jgi:hypothetical protein
LSVQKWGAGAVHGEEPWLVVKTDEHNYIGSKGMGHSWLQQDGS